MAVVLLSNTEQLPLGSMTHDDLENGYFFTELCEINKKVCTVLFGTHPNMHYALQQ